MEAENIHVIWLDDIFDLEDGNPEKDTLNDLAKWESNGVSITVVGTKDFDAKIENFESFQAVILDLHLNSGDPEDSDFLYSALKKIQTAKLPIYLYSANIDESAFRDLHKVYDIVGRFRKHSEYGQLIDRIIEDQNKDAVIFTGLDGWDYIANSGILTGKEVQSFRKLAKNYKNKDADYCPYNDMRSVLDDIVKYFMNIMIAKGNKYIHLDSLNNMVGQITFKNMSESNKSPLIPTSICPARIKAVIYFLNSMTQTGSHPDGSINNRDNCTNEDISRISEYRYNEELVATASSAFLIFIKWASDFFQENQA